MYPKMQTKCYYWGHCDCIQNVSGHVTSMNPPVSIVHLSKNIQDTLENQRHSKCPQSKLSIFKMSPSNGGLFGHISNVLVGLIENTFWGTF